MKCIKYIFLLLLFISCENELPDILVPSSDKTDLPETVFPIPQAVQNKIEGVYQVYVGSNRFGQDVVLRWNAGKLSIFSGKAATYFIMQGGHEDSTIYFEGYWRAATGSATGLVTLQIEKQNGGAQLLRDSMPDSLILTGLYGNEEDTPNKRIVLKFDYHIKKTSTDFYIIGHRGGGRNIDRLPHSENSLGMIEFAEYLGANAVEIDVKRTKDGVPVLFHDKYMNKRLINEDYFIGKISDYTFAQLRTFCTLVNGEQIPTLDEALKTVVEKTRLKLVWLDVKDESLIPDIVALQQQYLELARDMGRNVEILIGIPDETIFDEFLEFEDYINTPSLCELKVKNVSEANALVWAPRWSLGLLNEQVAEMHALGKRVFLWTLDDQVLIKSFLKQGDFDGFVTNYPSLTAYEYYRKK